MMFQVQSIINSFVTISRVVDAITVIFKSSCRLWHDLLLFVIFSLIHFVTTVLFKGILKMNRFGYIGLLFS